MREAHNRTFVGSTSRAGHSTPSPSSTHAYVVSPPPIHAERRRPPTDLVAGLVHPSASTTDPRSATALCELEALIAQRADWLADEAVRLQPKWHTNLSKELVGLPASQVAAATRDIAAYRERYNVTSADPLGTEPASTELTQLRHRSSLSQYLQRKVQDGPTTERTSDRVVEVSGPTR